MTTVDELLHSLLVLPAGQISPSVYETGRVVALAPWLAGHHDRWEYLLRSQKPDGLWSGPDEYILVSTLSAIEAILISIPRDRPEPAMRERLQAAADAGLRALAKTLDGGPVTLPDTVAVELILPYLITSLNGLLPVPLPMPANVDPAIPAKIRAAVEAGIAIPLKFAHSLEIAGAAAAGLPSLTASAGAVGCAPGPTVAWLADERFRRGHGDSVRYLESLVDHHCGPVPTVVPITDFERAWVVADIVRGFPGTAVPPRLRAEMTAAVSEGPVGGGAGLPPDADTTSATLFALNRLGGRQAPDCLFEFELDTHFCCWHEERTFSPTANAHVLEAFDAHLESGPVAGARYRGAIGKITRFLGDCQLPDGSWTDKWHASPYYAASCCVQALRVPRLSAVREAQAPVDKAVSWVLATQRSDGGWGRWSSTAEETAYALRVLLAAGRPAAEPALAKGQAFLSLQEKSPELPPLWHGKDLYTPAAVATAAIMATLNLLRHRTAGRIAS